MSKDRTWHIIWNDIDRDSYNLIFRPEIRDVRPKYFDEIFYKMSFIKNVEDFLYAEWR